MDNALFSLLTRPRSSHRRRLEALEYRILPGLCLRCGLPSGRPLDLCPGCENDFPLLDRGCWQCAVPLPTMATSLSGLTLPELSLSEPSLPELAQAQCFIPELVQTELPHAEPPQTDLTPARPCPTGLSLSELSLPGLSALLCGGCLADPPAFVRLRAAYRYEPPLSKLVVAAKNHRDLAACQVLGKLLAASLARQLAGQKKPDLLLPAPLHWRRRLFRGYNQALELARPVAQALEIPLAPRLVIRTRHLAQQGLGREERRRQLRRAFRVNGDVSNLHIAVIDDVATTTGTARALSQALMAAGAAAVEIWCLARTPLPKH